MNKKKTGLTVLIIIAIVALISTFSMISGNSQSAVKKSGPLANIFQPFVQDEYIAELHLEGVIEDENKKYNQAWTLSTIDDIKNDSSNVALAVFINSPGGGVYQADEVYLALKNYKDETGRPIYVYQQSLAASGGYYISMAADKIFANRNTLTGSIGVISGTSVDCTGLLEKIGIKSKTITAGKNKNMFNFNEPLTQEQKAIMQEIADECYQQFTQVICENRKELTVEKVHELADGRIYTAKQAKQHKLIDEIGTTDDFYRALRNEKLGGEDYEIVKFKYEKSPSLGEFLFDSITGKTNIEIPDELMPVSKIQYPAYMYTGF